MARPKDGKFSKAELLIELNGKKGGKTITKIPLHFNPNEIEVTRSQKTTQQANTGGSDTAIRVASIAPLVLKLPKLIFDGYEQGLSVRGLAIDALEAAITSSKRVEGEYSIVRLNWGKFMDSAQDADYRFIIRTLNVRYTMFLNDGTPVRAEVQLTLEQYAPNSGTTTHARSSAVSDVQSHWVRKGDTAQSIAANSYGDPREWRRVCDANKITDPMKIPAGSRITVPPVRCLIPRPPEHLPPIYR